PPRPKLLVAGPEAGLRVEGPAPSTTQHPAGSGIEHDGQEQEPRPRRDVRDIGDPQTVRTLGRERALDEIRSRSRVPITHGRLPPLAAAYACQARRSHQAGHALATNVDPFSGELGMDPRRPIGASRALV